MKPAAHQSEAPDVTAQLNELLTDVSTLIVDASRQEKRRLLMALDEFLPNNESMLNFWLQLLFKSRDIFRHIGSAPEHQQRRLLMMVEDLRASDRRRHPRIPCHVKVTVDDVQTEIIKNISVGGVFMQTAVPFSVGRQVSLVFPFPSPEDPIRMKGKIVWKSPVGVGVKFTSASKDLKKLIASLCQPLSIIRDP